MDGKERCKVETFIAVADAVNKQMASRFPEQQVAFMAQLWHHGVCCKVRKMLKLEMWLTFVKCMEQTLMNFAENCLTSNWFTDCQAWSYHLNYLYMKRKQLQWKNVTILSIRNQRVMMTVPTTKIVKTCQ